MTKCFMAAAAVEMCWGVVCVTVLCCVLPARLAALRLAAVGCGLVLASAIPRSTP